MEEWRPLPGYERFYAISSRGRIFRLNCASEWGTARHGFRYLKPNLGRYGYLLTRIFDAKGRASYVRLHRLVMLTFVGPPIPERPEVNHLNGIKTDNRIENLEYVSRQENSQHSIDVLGKQLGENHPRAKLTAKKVRELRKLHARGIGYTELSQRFGIDTGTIYCAVTRRTWAHVD